MYVDCPYCRGRGTVKSPLGISVDIHRQLSTIMRKRKKQATSVELQVVVHPTVLERLRREDEQFLIDLEREFEGRLGFKADAGRHVESFSINDATTRDVLYSNAEK